MHSPSTVALPGMAQSPVYGKKKPKKRVRTFTSDDRASHRVIEKQRREALNQQFLELARLLPGLANVRRLSKSVIVSESIAYLKAQRNIRLAAAKEIRRLLMEHGNTQMNLSSHQDGYNTILNGQQNRQINKALSDLLNVENEVFGTFPGGFGDNGPSDEHEEDHLFENTTQEKIRIDEDINFVTEDFLPSNEILRPEHNPEGGFGEASDTQVQSLPNHDVAPLSIGQPHQIPIQPITEDINCAQSLDFGTGLGLRWSDIPTNPVIPQQHFSPLIGSSLEDFSDFGSLQHAIFPNIPFHHSENGYFIVQDNTGSQGKSNSYQAHNPY